MNQFLDKRADARCDADGHCTVCGEAWPIEAETLEPHLCPPGFREIRPKNRPGLLVTDDGVAAMLAQLQAAFDQNGYTNKARLLPSMARLADLSREQHALACELATVYQRRAAWCEQQMKLIKEAQSK